MEESFRRQIAIGSAVGFSFLWIAAGYFTWILNGCKAYMPFISDFHLYSPGDFLFTTGTFVSGFLVFWGHHGSPFHEHEEDFKWTAPFLLARSKSSCGFSRADWCLFMYSNR